MLKKTILLSIILGVFTIGYAIYQYNKPHKSVLQKETFITSNALEFYNFYKENPDKAAKEIYNQILTLQGKVSSIEKATNKETGDQSLTVILDGVVKCDMIINAKNSNLSENDIVTIVGEYSAYDDMFEELNLIRCELQNE